MTGALVAGLVAGYGIAVPVGAVAVLVIGLTARTSLRVGASAALGVASADGVYATVAVLGGAALARPIQAVATPLRLVAAAVLVLIAVRTVAGVLRRGRGGEPAGPTGNGRLGRPLGAYLGLLGITLLNPTTIVYFAALVLGARTGRPVADQVVFVLAAFSASASWQLALAGGGSLLGRALTGERGRRITALASSAVIVTLAVSLALG